MGIDPEIVVVPVGTGELFPGLATVNGAEGGCAQDIDGMLVFGVCKYFDIVPGALYEAVVVGHACPAFAGIGGHKQAAQLAVGVALDQRIDALGIGAAYRNRHFTHFFRQAVVDLRPGSAPVRRLVHPASRAAADHFPGQTAVFPHRGIQNLRVVHIHRKFRTACALVHVQYFSPVLAPIGGAVDTAFGRLAVQRPLRCDEHNVGVLRVYGNARNVLGTFQPDALPGFTGIGRFEHPVAVVRHHPPYGVLAHPDVHDIGVGLRNGHCPYRPGAEIPV